jgi:hypothetical protein
VLMAWKLGLYGRDPAGRTLALDGTSRPVIGGHRDAGSTACPGQFLYDRLPAIRTRASAILLQSQIGGDAAIPVAGDIDGDSTVNRGWLRDGRWAFAMPGGDVRRFSFGRIGDLPLLGDFDHDGRAEPGIFRDGEWHLRSDASAGTAWRAFRFGQRGDVPVVGRWPGGWPWVTRSCAATHGTSGTASAVVWPRGLFASAEPATFRSRETGSGTARPARGS